MCCDIFKKSIVTLNLLQTVQLLLCAIVYDSRTYMSLVCRWLSGLESLAPLSPLCGLHCDETLWSW